MSFRKRFNKRIEEDKRSMLTDSDRAFLATLQNMVTERPEEEQKGSVKVKTFNYKVLLWIVAGALILALTVLIILYYTLDFGPVDPNPGIIDATDPTDPTDPTDKTEPPIEYFTDNFVQVESDIDELNGDLILFRFQANESKFVVEIKKTYDSVSGDTLFYTINISSISPDIQLTATFDIVVNENFTYDEIWYNRELIEATISDYTIKYTQDITSTSVGGFTINKVECLGEMQVGSQWVYVTKYQETSLTEGTFLETLQAMLKFD